MIPTLIQWYHVDMAFYTYHRRFYIAHFSFSGFMGFFSLSLHCSPYVGVRNWLNVKLWHLQKYLQLRMHDPSTRDESTVRSTPRSWHVRVKVISISICCSSLEKQLVLFRCSVWMLGPWVHLPNCVNDLGISYHITWSVWCMPNLQSLWITVIREGVKHSLSNPRG